jgi:hypothetical protein
VTPLEWLAAAGAFATLTVALSWLTIGFGLLAKTPAGANSLSLIPRFLPFVSSAFPTRTMPGGALVRAEPTVHPDHRHLARPPHRHGDRRSRPARGGVVRPAQPVGDADADDSARSVRRASGLPGRVSPVSSMA